MSSKSENPESESDSETIIEQFLSGSLSRRQFLARFFQITAAASCSSALACLYSNTATVPKLSREEDIELAAVLETLFPADSSAPGAADLHAVSYFHFVLLDAGVEQSTKEQMVNGLLWLAEEVQTAHRRKFSELKPDEREQMITAIVDTSWGENWCSTLITYLFEALLADPIYGGNPAGIGWQWLEHFPGAPRPTLTNKYPNLLR